MSQLSPEFLRFLEPEIRDEDSVVDFDDPDYVVKVQDRYGSLGWYIKEVDDEYQLWYLDERGGPDRFELSSTRLEDVEKYASLGELASIRREKYHFPTVFDSRFEHPNPGAQELEIRATHPGYEIWDSGVKRIFLARSDEETINKLTYYMDASWEELEASYADPEGKPLFPPATPEDLAFESRHQQDD